MLSPSRCPACFSPLSGCCQCGCLGDRAQLYLLDRDERSALEADRSQGLLALPQGGQNVLAASVPSAQGRTAQNAAVGSSVGSRAEAFRYRLAVSEHS